VLNLIKTKERLPRESKLLPALTECIEYLNQSLPDECKIEYVGFDIATANKKCVPTRCCSVTSSHFKGTTSMSSRGSKMRRSRCSREPTSSTAEGIQRRMPIWQTKGK
jgi:hypothetical protein